MKNSLKILVGSLALAALTACGGGGGGGGSSDPGPGAAGALGANNTQAYLGKGDWKGNLIGQNVTTQQFQMFMYQYGGGGQYNTQLVRVHIWSGYTGILPEQMGFSFNGDRRVLSGDAFINGNGLLINNYQPPYGQPGYGAGYGYPYNNNQVVCFAYPCPQQQYGVPASAAQGTPVLQISTQFSDVCRNTMQVQVRYQNVIVLSGPMTGPVTYNQQYAVGPGYNGGGYGYGQQPGYPGYNTGSPLAANIPPQCYTQQFAQW